LAYAVKSTDLLQRIGKTERADAVAAARPLLVWKFGGQHRKFTHRRHSGDRELNIGLVLSLARSSSGSNRLREISNCSPK
jgi:hypothetical protein